MRWNAEKLSEIYKMFISMYTQQMLICMRCSRLRQQRQTRWTFFRVKLVFECEFEITWSLGPWDLRTLDLGTHGPWNLRTLGLLDLIPPPTPPQTSPYILLPPPISSFSMVWLWGGEWVVTLEDEIGDGPLTFILILKSYGVGGWNPGTFYILFL